jgi:hypothetical protein
MLRLLADENFDNHILRGLQQRVPALDMVRVQDVGLMGADDSTILQWAAEEDRVVITHDVTTMTAHAIGRLQSGLPFPGVVEVKRRAPMGLVIDDIELFVYCGLDSDWREQITFIPLT